MFRRQNRFADARDAICVALAMCGALGSGMGAASAQTGSGDPFQKLRQSYSAEHDARRTHRNSAYYESVDGRIKFVFDHASDPPRLRFAGDDEIFVLAPHPASRGDTVYKLDNGEIILRRTVFGGVTIFAHGSKRGDPVVMKGKAERLRLPPPPAADPGRLALAIRRDLQIEFGTDLAFEFAPDIDAAALSEQAVAVAADAMRNAGKAVALAELDGRAPPVREVRLGRSERAWADVEGEVLHVYINDALDLEGRPSSASMVRLLRMSAAIE